MAYCNYVYYKTKYYGNVIAEPNFPRLATRASDKLDMLTYNRLGVNDGCLCCSCNKLDERTTDKVKKAVCALAEAIHDNEQNESVIRQNGGSIVTSVSSGSESISYKTDAVKNVSEQNKAYYDIVREYLSDTGLLYAGLD